MLQLKISPNTKTFLAALGLSSILLLVYKGLLAALTNHYTIGLLSWYPVLIYPLDNVVYIIRTFNWIIHNFVFVITGISDAPFHSVVVAPIIEELQFRGPLLFLKNQSKTIVTLASIGSTALFAICHPVPVAFVFFIFVVGGLCVYLTLKTRNLCWSILFHAFYNANLVIMAS